MKTIRLIATLAMLVLITANYAYAKEPLLLTNQVLMLDDFDAGSDVNRLGGTTQGDEEFPGGCIPTSTSASQEAFGGTGQSLKLEYDVMSPNSFAYYWSKLGPPDVQPGASVPENLKTYRYLSFWIKSEEKIPRFAVEFHQDQDDNRFFVIGKDLVAKVPAHRFLASQNPAEWRKIVIPLASFKQVKDWSKMLELVLVFEHKNRSKQGDLLVDDILFGSAEPYPEGGIKPLNKKEILGYLKINGLEVEGETFRLQPRNDLELFLKKIPLQIERVHFDVSMDKGQTWKTVKNFYEHVQGDSYRFQWIPQTGEIKGEVYFRASVSDIMGKPTVVSGPLKVRA